MDIQFKERAFYPEERRLLKALKARKEKEINSHIKLCHFIIAGVLGAGFTYITILLPDNFWAFLLGTLAVFSFSFIVFMPYELYKSKRKHKDYMQQLNTIINQDTVDTCYVHAKRIAVAEEYEDEGNLFIIEYDTDKVLYMWDYDYNLQKKFPCLEFEIYGENFFEVLGRQIYPLSARVKPLIIDKKAKWNYMSEEGVPGHLQIYNIGFDKLLDEYNKYT